MRAIKIIVAFLLFLFSLCFLLFGIVAFGDKEIGVGAGIFSIVLAGLAAWFGIKLLGIKHKKLPEKTIDEKSDTTEQPEAGIKKKTFREWLSETNKKYEEQNRKARELKEHQYQIFENSIGNHVYIDYEDAKGNFTSRTIEIKNVYEKNGQLYVYAYCFMKDANRTFMADRIFGMKNKYGGKKIKDIEGFLRRKFFNARSNNDISIEELADKAME